jgi:hypothetical protein
MHRHNGLSDGEGDRNVKVKSVTHLAHECMFYGYHRGRGEAAPLHAKK